MNKIFKILIIDKKMEAVTAFFLKNNQKYTKCAVAALKIDSNLYTKCIFCNNLTNIMLVMVYTDF